MASGVYIRTKEYRKKMSSISKGRVFSEKTRQKLSKSLMGNKNGKGNKGLHIKRNNALEVYRITTGIKMPAHKLNCECFRCSKTAWNKGKKAKDFPNLQRTLDKAHKARIGKGAWNKGKHNYWNNGAKSRFWKGGISKFTRTERQNIMQTIEYKDWRWQVFVRDNFTCQICGEKGGKLRANHIKKFSHYPELRTKLSNGITICENCDYKLVMWKEEQWESYFNFNLLTRGFLKESDCLRPEV